MIIPFRPFGLSGIHIRPGFPLHYNTMARHPQVILLPVICGMTVGAAIVSLARTAYGPDVVHGKNFQPWEKYRHRQYRLLGSPPTDKLCYAPEYES